MNEQGQWVPQGTDSPVVLTGEGVLAAQDSYYSGEVAQEENGRETAVGGTEQEAEAEITTEANSPETAAGISEEAEPEPEQAMNEWGMPLAEDGNVAYTQVEPEVTGQYLFDEEQSGLDSDEAEAFVKLRADEARKQADKLANKKPKMSTDLNKYKQAKAEWQAQVKQAEDEAAYWQKVQEWRKNATGENLLPSWTDMTPAMKQAVEDLKGDKTALDMLADQEPHTLEEIAADMLRQPGGVKLLKHDEEVNGTLQKGALSHSGFKQNDVKRFPFLFASSAKGGMSFEAAGEAVLERARSEKEKK